MRFFPIRKACLKVLALSLLLGQCPQPAHADPNTTDFETWQIGTIQGHLTKRFLYYLDTQNNEINLTDKKGNSANNNTHEGQLLVRPALGFQVTKGWSVWQGYGWAPTFQPQYRNEQQIWEQALYQHRFKHFAFSNRSRLELRWIQNTSGEMGVRFRNQLRVMVPFGKTRWGLVAFDEPFFNLNSVNNGPRAGFNQNWAFIGIERRLTNSMNLDVGYLNNYVRNFRPVPDRINNVIFVSLNVNMPGTGFDLNPSHRSGPAAKSKSSMMPTAPMAVGQEDGQQAGGAVGLLPVAQPNLEIAPITKPDAKAVPAAVTPSDAAVNTTAAADINANAH